MRRSFIGLILAAIMVAALPALALALSVSGDYDSVAIDRRAKEVVVSGHVTCDAGATGSVMAFVFQGSHAAGGMAAVSCTGSPTTWEVRVPLGSPPFHPGKATLEFGWSVSGGGTDVALGRSAEVKISPK